MRDRNSILVTKKGLDAIYQIYNLTTQSKETIRQFYKAALRNNDIVKKSLQLNVLYNQWVHDMQWLMDNIVEPVYVQRYKGSKDTTSFYYDLVSEIDYHQNLHPQVLINTNSFAMLKTIIGVVNANFNDTTKSKETCELFGRATMRFMAFVKNALN